MNKKSKVFETFQKISKILSWAIITILIIVILFLVVVVVSTKVNERLGKEPVFSLYTIISPSMVPNINVYDVVFTAKVNPAKLKVKDIISFRVKNSTLGKTPVTHRIIKIETTGTGERSYITKGDRNIEEDKWRYPVTDSDIVGKVIFKIPQLGRLQFFLTSKTGWFIVILLPALAIISFDLFKLMKLILIKTKITEEREKNILNNNISQEKVVEEIPVEEPKIISNEGINIEEPKVIEREIPIEEPKIIINEEIKEHVTLVPSEEIKEPEILSFDLEENKEIDNTPSIIVLPFDDAPVSTPVLEIKDNSEVNNEKIIQNVPEENKIELNEIINIPEIKSIEPAKEEQNEIGNEIEYNNYQNQIVTIEPVQSSEEKPPFEIIDK